MERIVATLQRTAMVVRAAVDTVVHDDDEGGYATEAVIITSLLVALAIAAVAIIAAKVLGTANAIQTQ